MSHFKEVIGQIIFLFTGKKKFLSIFYTIRKVAARGGREEVAHLAPEVRPDGEGLAATFLMV